MRVQLPHAPLFAGLRLPRVPRVAPVRTPRLQTEPRVTLPLDINNYPMAKFVRCHFKVRAGISQGALTSGHRPLSELTLSLGWGYGSATESLGSMPSTGKRRRKKEVVLSSTGDMFLCAKHGPSVADHRCLGPECREALGFRQWLTLQAGLTTEMEGLGEPWNLSCSHSHPPTKGPGGRSSCLCPNLLRLLPVPPHPVSPSACCRQEPISWAYAPLPGTAGIQRCLSVQHWLLMSLSCAPRSLPSGC